MHPKKHTASSTLLHLGWQAKLSTGLAILFIILSLFFLVLALQPHSQSTLERIKQRGVVRIGYAEEPPFATLDPKGRVTGASPEIARAIWQQLGVKTIEWIRTDFASLVPQLRAGRFDQIAAGLFIRPERKELVAFTLPLTCFRPALLVARGNPLHLHSLRDIAHTPKVKIGVLNGAVEEKDAHNAGIPSRQIFSYQTPTLALQALTTGSIQAVALSEPTVRLLAHRHQQTEQASPFQGRAPLSGCDAFAFRPEDTQLCTQYNTALQRFIGSSKHLQLIRPFGFTRENFPSTISSLQEQL